MIKMPTAAEESAQVRQGDSHIKMTGCSPKPLGVKKGAQVPLRVSPKVHSGGFCGTLRVLSWKKI